MWINKEYLIKHEINNVNVHISKDMEYAKVSVVFINGPRFNFKIKVPPKTSNLYFDIDDKIHEYIMIKDRKKN